MAKNTSPIITENGLTNQEYAYLGQIDQGLERYGGGLLIEVASSIRTKPQLARKLAQAGDASAFFRERISSQIPIFGMLATKEKSTDAKPIIPIELLVFGEYSRQVLGFMYAMRPRLVNRIDKKSGAIPHNVDFFQYGHRNKKGIGPTYQQLVYAVLRESLEQGINPDEILLGNAETMARGFRLPVIEGRALYKLLNDARGAFMEMYVATCWMLALEGQEFGFFGNANFPLWEDCLLNGEGYVAEGLKYNPLRKQKRAEIDLIFGLSEDQYQKGLESIIQFHE